MSDIIRWIAAEAGLRTNRLGRDRDPDSQAYADWLTKLNSLCERRLGKNLLDLPERPYRDWFDDGDTPEDGLREIARSGF